MDLETKHLAPYLPYKLKGFYGLSSTKKRETLQAIDTLGKCRTNEDLRWFEIKMFNPILKPLEDLNKDVQVNEELNRISFGTFSEVFDKKNTNKIPYVLFEILLENHYDVFDLINKGLAVDINELI